ncbi:MAG TPA: hypothetical protein VHB20_04410 [Verrucomicrobiae bacterium]|jgi:hypothetical protein|nr:hypothetical protein [Verrucomicrobiae bacterium]
MGIVRFSTPARTRRSGLSTGALRAQRKFLHFFPDGFRDPKYVAWERGYKWRAHEEWRAALGPQVFRELLRGRQFAEIAARAVRIESRTNLLFSFEKMALRDAVKPAGGAKIFAEGLFEFLHGRGGMDARFAEWCDMVGQLPRRQTRVLTWPVVTVFGFLAQPDRHFFLKPNVTKLAAAEYGFEFPYQSRPNPETYGKLLEFADIIRRDLGELAPRDMIDLQSFVWVQGSSEYDE